MANAGHKGMGHGNKAGHQTVGATDPALPDEAELGATIGNTNRALGGKERGRSQRQAMAGETPEAEDVLESFEKLDPKTRAGGAA